MHRHSRRCFKIYLRGNSLNVLILKKNLSIFIVVHKIKLSMLKKNPKQYHFFRPLYIWVRAHSTNRIISVYSRKFQCNITIITISRRPIFWHWCRWWRAVQHLHTKFMYCTCVFLCVVSLLPSFIQGLKSVRTIIMAKMHGSQL